LKNKRQKFQPEKLQSRNKKNIMFIYSIKVTKLFNPKEELISADKTQARK
jgi:hypothetical protein